MVTVGSQQSDTGSRKPKSSPANAAKQQVLPRPSLQWPCGIDKCTKSFAREADLKRHQKTTKLHSLPGFNCPQCDASFSRADALKRHQRSRHNGLVVDVEESNGDVIQSWGSTPSSSWSSTPSSSSWSSGSRGNSSVRSSRERQENEPPDILIVSTPLTPPVLTRSISYYRQLAESSTCWVIILVSSDILASCSSRSACSEIQFILRFLARAACSCCNASTRIKPSGSSTIVLD
ncbi:hypothetical protein C8J56DRAFT_330471 [Mycena floridula]|nr:hypothetical protein C8J56DRAFT_330471 [Mycena floridula]